MTNLILFGFKGCGKSHFGKLLSKRLKLPFIDTDTLIEKFYFDKFHTPLSCKQIAQEKGAAFFRLLEKEAVKELKNITHCIIAVGGGLVLDSDNLALIEPLGTLVYLEIDKAVLKERLFSGEFPSYLDPEEPEESFENMYHERKAKYEAIGAKTLSLHNKEQEEVLELLVKFYGK